MATEADYPALDDALLCWLASGFGRCGAGVRIFGHRLRPFTLAHRELLRIAGHPLASGGVCSLPDVFLAVELFRRTPTEAARWLLRERPQTWWRKLGFVLRSLRWGWRMESQVQALRDHVAAHSTPPDVMMPPAQGGSARQAPRLLDVLGTLAQHGMPVEQTFTQWPAALAEWQFLAIISQQVEVRFIDSEERKFQDHLRSMHKGEARDYGPERARKIVAEVKRPRKSQTPPSSPASS